MANKILTVKAKHFIGTSFFDEGIPCPLEKAAKDQYKTQDVVEYARGIKINGVKYKHEWYGKKKFAEDQIVADELASVNDVIRKITLTPI